MAGGKKRIVVSVVIGLLPIGSYGLTYIVPAKIIAISIVLLLLGLVLAGFAYTCPAWDWGE